MQIGSDDADLRETLEERMAYVPSYLLIFTGRAPRPAEIEEFRAYAERVQEGEER